MKASSRYGLMAEFATHEALLTAAHAARGAGYTRAQAYAPFPIEGLAEALGIAERHVSAITFAGAVLGAVIGFFMQWYSAVIDRPLNVGGRPLNSWPMFIPATFELAVLGGAIAAVLAFVIGSDLPRLRHPVFDAPDFDLATRNRFFLCLPADDPAFDARRAAALLDELEPLRRMEVPA